MSAIRLRPGICAVWYAGYRYIILAAHPCDAISTLCFLLFDVEEITISSSEPQTF